jgi:metal-responsive CopG/Arc/MetJ family transcriptional regulator
VTKALVKQVDVWRKRQQAKPNRSEAIRQLIARGMKKERR